MAYTYTSEGGLQDIAVVSPSDIWAVGHSSFEPDRPLVVHWNGTSWQIQKTPLDGLRGADLDGLSILSPNDIWAVGEHLVARYSC